MVKRTAIGFLAIFLLCAFMVANGEDNPIFTRDVATTYPVTHCPGEYALAAVVENGEFTGKYRAICYVCNHTYIALAPGADRDASEQTDLESCQHVYRRSEAPIREKWGNASWPVLPNGYHRLYTWFDLTCELCGDEATGYLPGNELFRHVNQEVADFHLSDEQSHLFIYCCDVCGQYSVEKMDCVKDDTYGLGMCQREVEKHQVR